MARPGLTGILLVGGASSRFGSPKAFAYLNGETLAERAWRILGETADERIAVGKQRDGLALPFAVLDDGSETRAALAGLVAGLRAAPTELCVVLPVDTPLVTPALLQELADGCADAAAPTTTPLPSAYRKSALRVLERRLEAGELPLHEALAELDTARLELDAALLVNVNTPDDLRRLG
ncbi:MAG: molybdenum cofactor guanylyltransferase [Gaiellaceae bacterium]